MPVSHEPWLVLLSVLVAIQGSYVGLLLAHDLDAAVGLRHRLLLAGSALTLAVGIWSMHFVGMLAARFPYPVDYLVFPTLLSFLICVLVVGIAVFATQAESYSRLKTAVAALAMGGGISGMHFVGMTAVHESVPHHHQAAAVLASILIAVVTSGLALWLLARRSARSSIFAAAVMLGLGIVGMHYTAMMGMVIEVQSPHMPNPGLGSSLSRETMAILTTCVAFAVSAVFLLSLVPEKRQARVVDHDDFGLNQSKVMNVIDSNNLERDAGGKPVPTFPHPALETKPVGEHAPSLTEARPQFIFATAETPSSVQSSALPLRGLGQPAVRRVTTLPVQKEGKPREIPVVDIFAVRANAHYTYVFDGKAEYFCNWAISEIEGRLDPVRFMRVHRSHIVAINRIACLKRSGDHGIVELDSSVQCAVPVARARFALLRSRVESQAI
ncbi:MAG: MHYT domain-containing protein [Beijerinckiaceae bacterium]